jgi:hypothetical protein
VQFGFKNVGEDAVVLEAESLGSPSCVWLSNVATGAHAEVVHLFTLF